MIPIPKEYDRRWSEFGFWRYPCGCSQFQDGWERCKRHAKVSYTTILEEFTLPKLPVTEVELKPPTLKGMELELLERIAKSLEALVVLKGREMDRG